MKTEIKLEPQSNGNLVINVYVDNEWFKEIIPEGNVTITEALNCVAHSLENDKDYNNGIKS